MLHVHPGFYCVLRYLILKSEKKDLFSIYVFPHFFLYDPCIVTPFVCLLNPSFSCVHVTQGYWMLREIVTMLWR